MSRKIVLRTSALGNRIYAGTLSKNNPNVMNDSKVDVTDDAIRAVFEHLMTEHKRENKGLSSFGYEFEGFGEIHFFPPDNQTLGRLKKYESALKEIAEETDTPYARIANEALNG